MARNVTRLLLGLVIIAVPAVSCGSDDSSGDLVFTTADSSIRVDEGDRFTIELEGNPTTGFSWEISNSPDASVVAAGGSEYLPSESGGDTVGGGGVFDFEFEAVGAGSTTIEFEYVQASAGAGDTASFEVEVSSD